MIGWYALFTKPHKEVQVQNLLIQRGIPVYFPTLGSLSLRSPNERAFFPRYLFAQCDLEQIGLNTLQFLPGMTSVVMFGGVPARVSDSIIAFLREHLAALDAISIHGEIIQPGDRVRITAGPFAHFQAAFDRRLPVAGRVRVLVDCLHRWATLDVNADTIRKIGGAPARYFSAA